MTGPATAQGTEHCDVVVSTPLYPQYALTPQVRAGHGGQVDSMSQVDQVSLRLVLQHDP